jgi:spore germination protein GerM
MAVTMRSAALVLITAASIGAGTWAAVRFLGPQAGPAPTPAARGAVPSAGDETRRIKASIFCVRPDGLGLEPVTREVPFAESTADQARRILEAMAGAPRDGVTSAIPQGVAVRGVYLGEHGEAYVDFTTSLRANHPGGSLNELLTVYAIVSTLTTNLPAITAVQILIDGHEVDTLAGHVDLRRPLPASAQWTERGPS